MVLTSIPRYNLWDQNKLGLRLFSIQLKNTTSIQAKKLNHRKGFPGSQRNPKGASVLCKDQPYSDFRKNQRSGDGAWTKLSLLSKFGIINFGFIISKRKFI